MRHLAAFLATTHKMPVAAPQPPQSIILQMSPVVVVTESPLVENQWPKTFKLGHTCESLGQLGPQVSPACSRGSGYSCSGWDLPTQDGFFTSPCHCAACWALGFHPLGGGAGALLSWPWRGEDLGLTAMFADVA